MQGDRFRLDAALSAYDWYTRTAQDPDLTAVIIFSVIGLLAAVCVMLLVPLASDTAAFLAQVS